MGVACPKFDLVWLNHSPIPLGRMGGNFLVQMISTCLPSRRGRRGGDRHSVGVTGTSHLPRFLHFERMLGLF
jgi:hypothetical protein